MSIGSLQLVRTWGFFVQDGRPSALQRQVSVLNLRSEILARGYFGCSSSVWGSKSFGRHGWSAKIWHDIHTFPVDASTLTKLPSLQARASAVGVAEQSKNVAVSAVKVVSVALTRTLTALQGEQLVVQCGPALLLIAFSFWGLGPTACFFRNIVKKKEDGKWSTSRTRHVTSSYLRPFLIWIGVIIICRAFDPVVLSTEASHAIKGRFIHFVRSLSTVLAFAYCTASLTQQIQKTMLERQEKENSRNLGVQFVGNTVYTSVWVAAVCLFMELLGFSTQRLITAGGFGTVLLTLAGREIFTNFLSSIMIHATRPFMENEWIQTKIEGQDVSGTVEHVGWWSPTVIRGDDREAVHIPNHKFTVSVVRNLSQKTHWRIKTHFGISHLDVGKIPDIVSDMRKVISKHPQVEQQRLHRRAFFDNIDAENQALLILVSCFVKTCHFEEYLRVKEIILLDLLRVISHHNARLATPIRSVQRIFDESEARQAPFRDVSPSHDRKRPLYMIEAAAVTVDDDSEEGDLIKGETTIQSSDIAKESTVKPVNVKGIQSVEGGSDIKSKTKSKDKAQVNAEFSGKPSGTISPDNSADDLSDPKGKSKDKERALAPSDISSKPGSSTSIDKSVQPSSAKPQLEGLDSMGLNSNDITLLRAAFEMPPADIPEGSVDSAAFVDSSQGERFGTKTSYETGTKTSYETAIPNAIGEAGEVGEQSPPVIATDRSKGEQPGGADPWKEQPQVLVQSTASTAGSPKSEAGSSSTRSLDEKAQPSQGQNAAPTASPALATIPRLQSGEENLVLGVALDGPKRTLPLDDDVPLPAKARELVTSRNGGGSNTPKERRDSSMGSQPNSAGVATFDGRDSER